MTRPEQEDTELTGMLAQLRGDQAVSDADAFGAALHRKLVQAGPPPAAGVHQIVVAWVRERAWVTGMLSGAFTGVAAFTLMSAMSAQGGHPGPQGPQAWQPAQAQPDLEGATAVATAVTTAVTRAAGRAAGSEAGTVAGTGAAAADCVPAPVAETRAEVFIVPAGQVALVQLHFAVDSEVDEAEFSILLPAGLAFFSEGEALPERAFHWVAPLDAGDNEIPVAIVGQSPGRHRVTATATVDGEVVVHEVVLEVREAV